MSDPASGPSPSARARPRRTRRTRRAVIVADRLARGLITVGGIGTIAAVVGVSLFLVWVALPLFRGSRLDELGRTAAGASTRAPAAIGVDEYLTLAWTLGADGRLDVLRLDDGKVVASHDLAAGAPASALHDGIAAVGEVLVGHTDGSIDRVAVRFRSRFVAAEDLTPAARAELDASGERALAGWRDGVVERVTDGKLRWQRLEVEAPVPLLAADPGRRSVRALAYVERTSGPLVAAWLGTPVELSPAAAVEVPRDASSASEGAAPRAAASADRAPAADGAPVPLDAPAAGDALAGDVLAGGVAPPPAEPGLVLVRGRQQEDFFTGETTLAFDAPIPLALAAAGDGPAPVFLGLSGTGADLYAVWADGGLVRVELGGDAPVVAERAEIAPAGAAITSAGFALGHNTLLWGSSDGVVRGGFPVRIDELDGRGIPGAVRHRSRARSGLVVAKEMDAGGVPLAIAPSERSRLLAIGTAAGEVRLASVTSATMLAGLGLGAPVEALAVAPKEDAIVAWAGGGIHRLGLERGYPEAGFDALFEPVWYEGYARPTYTWQSTGGTDDFEPKLSLVPLIFGTLKATFYSMLFGAPLALLAAVYSSEFLRPRARAVIKPTIELMASLPSVVLGFLAALVLAPFVERWVASVLTSFVLLPFCFLASAYLWQLLPARTAIRLEPARWLVGLVVLPVGMALSAWLGPLVERVLFGGDVTAWLAYDPRAEGAGTGPFASAWGGWAVLVLPLAAVLVAVLVQRVVNPRLRRAGLAWERERYARVELAKFAVAVAVTLGVAAIAASLISAVGLDPRGSLVDTYVQRNALVVGFVMGFAIIPIVYTLAEDALSTVPEHLRSASLGAGATPWQTASRVVIPTAMSGLFSALMIGLGRAVGETMIVLMAAGNTPVMSVNIFEGMRTLSANIAVELPEAVQGSTHYRTLFLAALVLFAMTFVVNTLAEVVRARFRRRAYQL